MSDILVYISGHHGAGWCGSQGRTLWPCSLSRGSAASGLSFYLMSLSIFLEPLRYCITWTRSGLRQYLTMTPFRFISQYLSLHTNYIKFCLWLYVIYSVNSFYIQSILYKAARRVSLYFCYRLKIFQDCLWKNIFLRSALETCTL